MPVVESIPLLATGLVLNVKQKGRYGPHFIECPAYAAHRAEMTDGLSVLSIA